MTLHYTMLSFELKEVDSMADTNRLDLLREKMRQEKVDLVYVPTADPHMSEYVTPAYQSRAFLTGFTGSAGTAVVSMDEAKLWADGRYFIQAEREIKHTGFDLMKLATPGYPGVLEWIEEKMPQGGTLATNAWTLSEAWAEAIQQVLERKGATLRTDLSLVEDIWENRPELPISQAFLLDENYSGKSTAIKLEELREDLENRGIDYELIGQLEDVAWLYNIRGGDVKSTPVLIAYALIGKSDAFLFVDETKVPEDVRQALAEEGVGVLPYDAITEAVRKLNRETIRLDKNSLNAYLFSCISDSNTIVDEANWTKLEKAKKNPTEIENQKLAYLKDGIAVTRLIYWLTHHENLTDLTEWNVSETLLSYRKELDHFLEESFTTIAAYGPNAAMMHYAPKPETAAHLKRQGFLLVDSGGQYLEGTTDTTRTFALGALTDEEKKDYTLTLKSHVQLARAVFLKGTTGTLLDALARQPMWQEHLDYKCGTGHGVGYLLSVHEGPQSFSKTGKDIPLEPGMVITIEPGVYKEGKHGIRTENVYYVEEDCLVGTDQFYKFGGFTLVPFDREAIVVDMLTQDEIDWVNRYHENVYEALAPHLKEEEAEWLKDVCRPIN